MDLLIELDKKRQVLNQKMNDSVKAGMRLAQAEHDYRVCLKQNVLKLEAEGYKVTTINLIIYGIEEVADKRLERDKAQVLYDANKDAINSCKLELKLLEAQIQREWGSYGTI